MFWVKYLLKRLLCFLVPWGVLNYFWDMTLLQIIVLVIALAFTTTSVEFFTKQEIKNSIMNIKKDAKRKTNEVKNLGEDEIKEIFG